MHYNKCKNICVLVFHAKIVDSVVFSHYKVLNCDRDKSGKSWVFIPVPDRIMGAVNNYFFLLPVSTVRYTPNKFTKGGDIVILGMMMK